MINHKVYTGKILTYGGKPVDEERLHEGVYLMAMPGKIYWDAQLTIDQYIEINAFSGNAVENVNRCVLSDTTSIIYG